MLRPAIPHPSATAQQPAEVKAKVNFTGKLRPHASSKTLVGRSLQLRPGKSKKNLTLCNFCASRLRRQDYFIFNQFSLLSLLSLSHSLTPLTFYQSAFLPTNKLHPNLMT